MAHIAFLVAALSVTLFFLWRKRLDPLAVALGSSLVYFAPGILGMMHFSFNQGELYNEPIAAATYGVMGIVLVALAMSAVIVDLVPPRGPYAASFESKVPAILLAFVIVAAAVSIQHTGVYFLCLDKSIVLQKIDKWYSYAWLSLPFCVATAYALRQGAIFFVGCLFFIADFYAGFRAALAISLLAVIMLSSEHLFRGWRRGAVLVLAVLLAGCSLIVIKQLMIPAKYLTASYCETRLALDKAAGTFQQANKVPMLNSREYHSESEANYAQLESPFTTFILRTEPFVIQATLNEVVRRNFRTDKGYLAGQILAGLPLGERLFGIDSSFGHYFQFARATRAVSWCQLRNGQQPVGAGICRRRSLDGGGVRAGLRRSAGSIDFFVSQHRRRAQGRRRGNWNLDRILFPPQ